MILDEDSKMSDQALKEQEYESLEDILTMLAVDPEQLQGENIALAEYFSLRDSNYNELGTFWAQDLKNLIKSYPDLFSNDLQVHRLDQSIWVPLFSHPFFQRRAFEIIPGEANSESTESLQESTSEQEEIENLAAEKEFTVAEQYFLKIDGERLGPISYEEVEKYLLEHKLLFTDKISTDGQQWCSVYELPEFDRRKHTPEQLPAAPSSEIFGHSQFEVITGLIEHQNDEDWQCLNVMAGLAYVRQVHEGKIVAEEEHRHEVEPEVNREDSSKKHQAESTFTNWQIYLPKFSGGKIVVIIAIMAIAIGGIWNFSSSSQKTNKHVAVKTKSKVYHPKATKIDPQTVRNRLKKKQSPSAKRQQRSYASISNRRPSKKIVRHRTRHRLPKAQKSFRESEAFRAPVNLDEVLYDEESDNNLEQDPVQASLSREIVNPTDESEDSYDTLTPGVEEGNPGLDEDAPEMEGPDEEVDLFEEELSQ